MSNFCYLQQAIFNNTEMYANGLTLGKLLDALRISSILEG